MTVPDQLRAAVSNVGRRKMRSALASLGVVVGTVTIVVMVSLAAGVRQQINRQFASLGLDRLIVTPSGGRRGFDPFGPASPKKPITDRDVGQWQALSGVKQVIPEVNLPASVDLQLNWNGTNQSVRMSGGDFRGGGLFQEVPQPVAGSLELSEAGGMILSQGAVRAAGIASNDFPRVIGQAAEVVLRTSRGETQRFPLRVQGISQERCAAHPGVGRRPPRHEKLVVQLHEHPGPRRL